MQPTASALIHNVAKFMDSLINLIASESSAIIASSLISTFSNEISAHDWSSMVLNELIETPFASESTITKVNLLSFMQVTISLLELPPLRTNVLVPFKILLFKVVSEFRKS